jgi:hypothetical protein
MTHLLFISRVAFISNVCMLVTFIMRYVHIIDNKEIQSTIIIAGFLLSFVFNLIAAVVMLLMLFSNQAGRIHSAAWLFTVNFLCFIFQLYFLLK